MLGNRLKILAFLKFGPTGFRCSINLQMQTAEFTSPKRRNGPEREGFEPPVPLRVQRFSRPPLSTAQPPLHNKKILTPFLGPVTLDCKDAYVIFSVRLKPQVILKDWGDSFEFFRGTLRFSLADF